MSDELREFLGKVFADAGAQLLSVTLAVVAVAVPVVVLLYLFIRRLAARHGMHLRLQWKSDDDSASAPQPALPPAVSADDDESITDAPRRLLARLYKLLMAGVSVALLVATVVAWRAATPANGLLLVALLLGVLTLIAFLSIDRLDRQQRAARAYREIFDGLRSRLRVSTVRAPPTVHVLDAAALGRARERSRQGASLEAVCRAVSPDYARWSPEEQAAFQAMMRAVLER